MRMRMRTHIYKLMRTAVICYAYLSSSRLCVKFPNPHGRKDVALSWSTKPARHAPAHTVGGLFGAKGAVSDVYPPTQYDPSPMPRYFSHAVSPAAPASRAPSASSDAADMSGVRNAARKEYSSSQSSAGATALLPALPFAACRSTV